MGQQVVQLHDRYDDDDDDDDDDCIRTKICIHSGRERVDDHAVLPIFSCKE